MNWLQNQILQYLNTSLKNTLYFMPQNSFFKTTSQMQNEMTPRMHTVMYLVNFHQGKSHVNILLLLLKNNYIRWHGKTRSLILYRIIHWYVDCAFKPISDRNLTSSVWVCVCLDACPDSWILATLLFHGPLVPKSVKAGVFVAVCFLNMQLKNVTSILSLFLLIFY